MYRHYDNIKIREMNHQTITPLKDLNKNKFQKVVDHVHFFKSELWTVNIVQMRHIIKAYTEVLYSKSENLSVYVLF